jgi:hypothetical protein
MSGGEQVRVQEGELWWFDNNCLSDVINTAAVIGLEGQLLLNRCSPLGGLPTWL